MAADRDRTAPAELNVVSGGHVACPACGARITRLRGTCPHCETEIAWEGVRIVRERRRRGPLGRILRAFR